MDKEVLLENLLNCLHRHKIVTESHIIVLSVQRLSTVKHTNQSRQDEIKGKLETSAYKGRVGG